MSSLLYFIRIFYSKFFILILYISLNKGIWRAWKQSVPKKNKNMEAKGF